MRIGIDARPLSVQPRTGIANYLFELLGQLPERAPEHEYFLYSNRPIDNQMPQSHLHVRIDGKLGNAPSTFWLFARGRHFAQRDRLDVFWSTTSIAPFALPKNVMKVSTVYDLVWRRFPETMQTRNLWLHRAFAERVIRNSDRVIAISRSTANDVRQFLRVPNERISLVYPALSKNYKPQDQAAAADFISLKYDVPPAYLATVATIEPRKNLSLLIRVLKILKESGRLVCPLLICGASGWKNSPLFHQVRDSGLTEEHIRFLGFLSSEDLPRFYAGARVFLFPSLYEGFGLPPVEAMACGTPVIAANSQPMPEVLGDAAILESPLDPESFANAITRVLADRKLLHTMRERGFQKAQTFDRRSSAQQLLSALCGATSPALQECPELSPRASSL
jgi:glycosyltransferase involved in cell wall biosynthesis